MKDFLRKYVLDDTGKPVLEPDLFKWGKWMETCNRRVKRETIGKSDISTVFLGLDHNWKPDGPPILWETMVFGGPLDEEMERCSGSKEQAEAMHCKMVNDVLNALNAIKAAENISRGNVNE